jgi:hypothetical protein
VGIASWIAAGCSVGLLLGALAGLSVSPVVGTLIGTVTALAVGYFGFKEHTAGGHAADGAPRRWGVAAFSLACLAGIFAGLTVRSAGLLSPTPKAEVELWKQAGYGDQDAHDLVALRLAGLVPKGATVQQRTDAAAASSVLFAAESDRCADLRRARFASVDDWRRAFGIAGGSWATLATASAGVEPRAQEVLLASAWSLACAPR